MPTTQLMLLGVMVAGFAIFMITLLGVSLYVSAGAKKPAPAEASPVSPARRAD